jgi:hypothetical protein
MRSEARLEMVLSILMGYCAMARRSECACKSARFEKSEPALLDGLVSVSKLRWQHRARRGAISCVAYHQDAIVGLGDALTDRVESSQSA